jgi:hypothetical protein
MVCLMSDTTVPGASTPPALIPPGWYDEGTGSGRMRWWSGVGWTEHVAVPTAVAAPVAAPAPAPMPAAVAAPAPAPVRPALPADRPVYSVWIWLVVLLPLLSYTAILFYRPEFDDPSGSRSLASVFSPAYFALLLTGLLVYGLMVLFAWRDVVWLRKQGVVQPFPWAWTFLHAWIYIIGRSVIVFQVARPRGRVPIWVLIAVAVVGFTVSIVWSVTLLGGMYSQLTDPSSYSNA